MGLGSGGTSQEGQRAGETFLSPVLGLSFSICKWGDWPVPSLGPLLAGGGPLASYPTFIFTAKDYENAIKFYSQAIELNPSNAIYYGNRSLAYLRTECYGYALADATRAIEMDKKYIKGYYRRAASNMALGKFRAALRDYETVSGPEPRWC